MTSCGRFHNMGKTMDENLVIIWEYKKGMTGKRQRNIFGILCPIYVLMDNERLMFGKRMDSQSNYEIMTASNL